MILNSSVRVVSDVESLRTRTLFIDNHRRSSFNMEVSMLNSCRWWPLGGRSGVGWGIHKGFGIHLFYYLSIWAVLQCPSWLTVTDEGGLHGPCVSFLALLYIYLILSRKEGTERRGAWRGGYFELSVIARAAELAVPHLESQAGGLWVWDQPVLASQQDCLRALAAPAEDPDSIS